MTRAQSKTSRITQNVSHLKELSYLTVSETDKSLDVFGNGLDVLSVTRVDVLNRKRPVYEKVRVLATITESSQFDQDRVM
jgi:hypothetical protein